jgi:chromate transport protein ChrA
MDAFTKWLQELFGKLPNLPGNVREVLVKIAPYLAIIGVLFSLPGILAIVGLGAAFGAYGYGYGYGGGIVSIVLLIATAVLMALAIPGLFARKESGWRYLFYTALVSAISSLVMFNLGSLIIGTGLTLYILFQVRSSYR